MQVTGRQVVQAVQDYSRANGTRWLDNLGNR
jgi:hypothetical protein